MRAIGALILGLWACGGPDGPGPATDSADGGDAGADGSDGSDGADGTDASDGSDGGADTGPSAVPLLPDALDCGERASVGSIPPGESADALLAFSIDTDRFPDALCNDGSTPVFYVRPAETAAGQDRWVLQLLGGGGCSSPEACARRWCHVGTNFSMTQMSSRGAPDRTDGVGIFARPAETGVPEPQPFADANQVLIKYCSSDIWRGTVRDVVRTAPHPTTGEEVEFRMHFLGRRILEAVVDTLRQDGVPALEVGADGRPLADLDDATTVVLAGASAGGGGTTYALDWLAGALREHQPTVEVLGLVDSTFGPSGEGLDFSSSTYCSERGLCDTEAFLSAGREAQEGLWQAAPEASCESHHAATGDGWWCASDTHVMLHHLATPVFIRQGLNDGVISETFTETGVRVDGADIDMAAFAGLIQGQYDVLRGDRSDREEGADVPTSGGFAPLCPKHETLRSTADTFTATVAVPDSGRTTMFEQWQRWRRAESPAVVYARVPEDSTCP